MTKRDRTISFTSCKGKNLQNDSRKDSFSNFTHVRIFTILENECCICFGKRKKKMNQLLWKLQNFWDHVFHRYMFFIRVSIIDSFSSLLTQLYSSLYFMYFLQIKWIKIYSSIKSYPNEIPFLTGALLYDIFWTFLRNKFPKQKFINIHSLWNTMYALTLLLLKILD